MPGGFPAPPMNGHFIRVQSSSQPEEHGIFLELEKSGPGYTRQVEVPRRSSSASQFARSQESLRAGVNANADQADEPKEELRRLRRELGIVKSHLHTANQKYNDEKAANRELREQLHDAADEMHKMQADRSFNQDDGFFQAEWSKLRYNIMNCMEQNFNQTPSSGWLQRERAPKDEFKQLTADYKAFLKNDAIRPLLMQALVWNTLCQEIFATSSQISPNTWAGNAGGSFKHLARDLREAHRSLDLPVVMEYHRWRVATASMLHEHPGLIDKKSLFTKLLAEQLATVMKPWLANEDSNFEKYLAEIYEQAMDLDMEMQKQRAHYYVRTWKLTLPNPGSSVPFPASIGFYKFQSMMESLNEEASLAGHERPLSLVVCPALMKAGNADGEQYGAFDTLVRATVFEHMDNIAQWSKSSRKGKDILRSLWNPMSVTESNGISGGQSPRPDGTRSLKPLSSTTSRKDKRWKSDNPGLF